MPRRRHVDRLLEEGAVERIGLVEEGEQAEPPAVEEPLERHLPPGHEGLDQHPPALGVPAPPVLRRLEDGVEAPPGGGEAGRIVGAHDAAARAHEHRLQHAREAEGRLDLARHACRGVGDRGGEMAGRPHPAALERLAHRPLVARRAGGIRRVVPEPEGRARSRRELRPRIIDPEDSVERPLARRGEDGRERLLGPIEVAEERGVRRPDLGQHVAAVGAEDRLDSEPLGRREEVLGPIGGGGDEEEDARPRSARRGHDLTTPRGSGPWRAPRGGARCGP
jgi:hypothetical protein